LTEEVAHDHKNRLTSMRLVPSSGGVFEARLNGRDIYSKRATGQFPDDDQIVAHVGTLLPDTP